MEPKHLRFFLHYFSSLNINSTNLIFVDIWSHLIVIIDLYSRQIAGWSMQTDVL